MVKKKKFLIFGIVVLCILMISGVSFAIWQMTLQQTTENVISTGCFKIEFSDKNPIRLDKAYPISDEEGSSLVPYEFTITNTCDSFASYQINLEILDTTTLENLDYLKIMLDDYSSLLTENDVVTKTLKDATLSYKLETGYLDIKGSKTFSFRLWMDEETPTSEEFMNKLFESKITIVSNFQTDFDRENPVVDFVVNKEDTKVVVDASSSYDNEKIKYYYYSKDGENYIRTTSNTYTFEEKEINYGKGTNSLIELEQNTVNQVFMKAEDEYGNQSEVKSLIVGVMLYDETVDNNLRYVGANPNNYVSFNNELWRIIGVMNNVENEAGQKESRIKLIRNDVYSSSLAWDDNNKKEWGLSTNQVHLNSTYLNTLDSKSYRMISDVKYQKGICVLDSYHLTPLSLSDCERIVNSNWLGKIGLIYVSDYSFATSGGTSLTRKICLNSDFDYGKNTNVNECIENNWLNNFTFQWTMTILNSVVLDIANNGKINSNNPNNMNPVRTTRPVLYLNPNVKIIHGDGSEHSPFEMSLD